MDQQELYSYLKLNGSPFNCIISKSTKEQTVEIYISAKSLQQQKKSS